jgi:flagellar motor switch protein FliN/FliY
LYDLDKKPLLDRTFAFPWKELSDELQRTFHCNVTVTAGSLEWKSTQQMYDGIVAPTLPIGIVLSGIKGQLLILVSRKEIERFMSVLLHADSLAIEQQDAAFFDQFSAFVTTELLACAQGMGQLKQLSLHLVSPRKEEGVGCLCQDIELTIEGQPSLARLIIPPDFLDGWREAHTKTTPQVPFESLGELELRLCIEGGRTFLTSHELATLQKGDFLRLDHPFFIPGSTKSRVFISHKGQPLFRAKVEEGAIKILEMPLQHEAFLPTGGLSMATQDPPSPQTPEARTTSSGTAEAAANPPPVKKPSDTSAEQESFEWEEKEEEKTEELPPLTEAEAQKVTAISPTLTKEPIDIRQFPLTIVVELAELSMSIEKVMALQPGNLLDLDVRPENGVTLVANGKVFGQGELILIGDNVGVRITEIGFEQPMK